jgi:L-cysteine/cystine lyase
MTEAAGVWARSTGDREKIAAIRAELPATERYVYFNTGTNGPLPRRSHDALLTYARIELEEGRSGQKTFDRLLQNLSDGREAMASVLGCEALDIALTHNTTEGMNIALMGIDWRPGDEVVTSSLEHPGGLYPLYNIRTRYGVKLRTTEIGRADRDPIEELRRVLTWRTRAVVLSHVSWATGMVLPILELAALTHSVGALFICDAAQSCGMVPTNVFALGVDAYACSGQKWLCGPDGTGALFVRRDRLADIQQTYMGYFGVRHGMSDFEGHFVPPEGACRFESATLYPPSLKALVTSIGWIRDELGWEWVYRRIAALGQYCHQTLSRLDGVTLLTPRERMAGLIHFTVAGIAPADLTTRLHEEAGIHIRDTHYPEANRVSLGFYNTEDEVDRLVEAIRMMRRS